MNFHVEGQHIMTTNSLIAYTVLITMMMVVVKMITILIWKERLDQN
jgi:hypothetical protein